jgi:thiamine pyrophosphokinase
MTEILPVLTRDAPICLVGGGPVAGATLAALTPTVTGFVGVDSGADLLLARGISPLAVIGDLDSLSQAARTGFAAITHHIREQDTTDFEKALLRIRAPLIFAIGFTGGRLDHSLSVLNAMARHPAQMVVLVDEWDLSFLVPQNGITLDLPAQMRVSLMPLGNVTATASGLRWPFADWPMHPAGAVSASNMALGGPVRITAQGPLLLTLPRAHLPSLNIPAGGLPNC